METLVKLTKTIGKNDFVWVNPNQVRCVYRMPDGAVRIEFDSNHFVMVDGELATVSKRLATATKAPGSPSG